MTPQPKTSVFGVIDDLLRPRSPIVNPKRKEWLQGYRLKNRLKLREYDKKYYSTHLERMREVKRAYKKRYYAQNPQKLKDAGKRWYQSQKLRGYRKGYYQKNRTRILSYAKTRRASRWLP